MTLPNGANDRVKNEGNLLDRLDRLERLVASMGRRDVDIAMVSDLTDNLGDVRAGRFLALSTGGEPDDEVACGVGMDASGQEFAGGTFNIYGVQNGALMFGLESTTGGAVFLGGAGRIDANGISITGETYAIQQEATGGAETRRGRLEMFLAPGGTIPVWSISFTEPSGTDLTSNGDFETGDFTGWTKTTETNGTWGIGTATPQAGTYYAAFSKASSSATGVLTGARITGITAGQNYRLDFYYQVAYKIAGDSTLKAEIKWYDDPAAGSLLRTDTALGAGYGSGWKEHSYTTEAPAGAESAVIVFTYSSSVSVGPETLKIDTVTLVEATVSKQLLFTDSGMSYSDGMWPVNAGWWFYEVTGGPTLTEYMSATYAWGVLWGTAAADANNGDTFPFPRKLLMAGDYRLRIRGFRSTDRGTIDVYADGAVVDTIALNGASEANFTWVTDTFSLGYSGLHEIKFVVNGTAGSDYRVVLNRIDIYKV